MSTDDYHSGFKLPTNPKPPKVNKRRDRTAVNQMVDRLEYVKQWGVDTSRNNTEQKKFDKMVQQGLVVPGKGVE